jgi:hypothetical protein
MAKRPRPSVTPLARLERELSSLNARRDSVIAQIKHALEHLTLGSFASMAGPDPAAHARRRRGASPGSKGGRRPGFKMSAAAKAKISAAAKKRWAERRRQDG